MSGSTYMVKLRGLEEQEIREWDAGHRRPHRDRQPFTQEQFKPKMLVFGLRKETRVPREII